MPFETFGFATNYTVDLNPEQPGVGWGDRARVRVRAGVNEAVVAVVTPHGGEPWLAIDGATAATTPLLCATPNPDLLCFYPGSNEFGGVLVDVTNATPNAEFNDNMRMAYGSPEFGLLLLVSFTDMLAVGAEGVIWESDRLAYDDLQVLTISAEGILCEGFLAGSSRSVSRSTLRQANRSVAHRSSTRFGVASHGGRSAARRNRPPGST